MTGMEIPSLSPNDTSFVNIVSTYVLPIVSGINIWVNVINIVILARPIFKGSVYRYLLFNSLFDVFTLSLIALKPTLKTVLTEHVDEDYIYVYLTSCFLMCSDLCTVAALLERIIKLGGRMRKISSPSNSSWFTGKRHSYRFILFAIVVFSALVNSPVLYVHKYFEIEWFFKNVFFELSLTPYGWSQFWAKFIYAISLIVNLAIFFLTIFLNSSVYKLMKKNAKKLKQFIDTENAKSGAGEYVINIVNDMDDMRDYDDDEMDEIDLDKEITATGPSVVAKIQQMAKARVRFQSALEMPSGDLNTMESIASAKHDPIEMEAIRRKLCDLVIYNSYIYLIGHIMFILINTLQKCVNLIASSNYIDSENLVISVFHALSNFTLYSSLGLTFFVHLIYNVKFRYVLKKAWKRIACCCSKEAAASVAEKATTPTKTEEKII